MKNILAIWSHWTSGTFGSRIKTVGNKNARAKKRKIVAMGDEGM